MSIPFIRETRREFDLLARQFGMSCVSSNEREVRYENEASFLVINFDRERSYELGVEVGKKQPGQPQQAFSLPEVLRLRNVKDAADIDGMMVRDVARLPEALRGLAQLVLEHASDFLQGNGLSFAQLAGFRKTESDAYALRGALRVARAKSEAAWDRRDYRGVVESLESLEQDLTPAEKKRLAYSRQHLIP